MGSSFLLFIVTLLLSCFIVHSGPLSLQPLTPNFTASNFKFIDTSGSFLSSPNGTFKAAITNTKPQERSYYFVIVHSESHVVVWSANRDMPVSDSGELRLSVDGLTLFDDSGDTVWSAKRSSTSSSVTSMQLLESGNLVLVDAFNKSVWESFDSPTDTIVVGQRLPVGKSLVSSVKEDELAKGDYELVVVENDAMLQWNEKTYWKLSMEPKAFTDAYTPVEYMMISSNGLFLLGANGTDRVIQVNLDELKDPDFRIAKLEENGHFSVKRLSNGNWMSEFDSPIDSCRVAFTCKKLGVCDEGRCSCPPGFRVSSEVNGSCAPVDRNLVMPVSCNASLNMNVTELGNRVSYLRLENGLDYFANDFIEPVKRGVNVSACQDLCSKNCSCLSVFHDQSSGSCYMIENFLGSILRGSDSGNGRGRLGYVKVISEPSLFDPNDNSSDKRSRLPVVALVLLPSSGLFLIIVMMAGIMWLMRRKRLMQISGKEIRRTDSSSSADLDSISILGLPVKFDHEEIRVATECFTRSYPHSTSVEPKAKSVQWVFLGCPGVGKGTYASRLSTLLGVPHIATGDLVRDELKSSGPLSKQLAEIVNQGKLVSDEIILNLLSKRLESGEAKGEAGFILDGFPRTVRQAEILTEVTDIDLVVNLKLPERVLVEKCLGRRICSECGKNFNVASIDVAGENGAPRISMAPLNPPSQCISKLITRADDTEAIVKERLSIYWDKSQPVEDFYRSQGKLLEFDLPGGIPESWPKLLEVLNLDEQEHKLSAAA